MKNRKQKSYDQNCALARAMDILGERWTLLLIRELLTGPKRYTDLKTYLVGINAKLLSDRLKHLAEFGIVEQVELPPPANSAAYALTPAGEELEETIIALVKWGIRHTPKLSRKAHSFPHWSVIASRAMFDPEHAKDIDISCQFHVDGVEIYWIVKNGKFLSGLGRIPAPDVAVTCSKATFSEFDGTTATTRTLIDSGKLEIDGSRRTLMKFANVFSAA